MRIGLDVGSTTLKCVVSDEFNNIIYKDYRRHFSLIAAETRAMLGDIISKFPTDSDDCTLVISGSAGMGFAQSFGIDFVQEVYATSIAVKSLAPDSDVVIELGGEDAKILFLGTEPEVRMNGSCAGGTGAFIDQMATLLDISPTEMNELSTKKSKIYTIASRCGVFAKSDIQPLLNQGAEKKDICASIFRAVVNQTIAGLAQGRAIGGRVLYLGGPLTFLSELREAFDAVLETRGICPENSLYYVAYGAAISTAAMKTDLTGLVSKIESFDQSPRYKACPPLFRDKAQYADFVKRHGRAVIKTDNPPKAPNFEAFLGIDAGSTTVKAVIIDGGENIIYTSYRSGTGNPVTSVKYILDEIYEKYPEIKIKASAVTGYGEEIIQNAFAVDFGIVETVAHYLGASKFSPEVDFIIDIGGQDIKCFKIVNNAIDNIFLNEACSSGCGSFLQTFAAALGYSAEDFAKLGLFADSPVDLGSRCTVFMNSSVKQAQKDGSSIENISAGLSVSVVKNALYKVIRAASKKSLGKNIVLQGGTFLNDAVLAAFEAELGVEVVRPNIAGLMGAYGAALYARRGKASDGGIITAAELSGFSHSVKTTHCRRCTNSCLLTVNDFGNGRKYIGGNRCEMGLSDSGAARFSGLNIYEYKKRLLDTYKNKTYNETMPTISIPMGLGMFEMLPFWHKFFGTLGFNIQTSPESDRQLYLSGQSTIPSDTVCYPAKIIHGHIDALIKSGAENIFFPCVTYNFDEAYTDNHYNCPVVAYYPEVAASNIQPLKSGGINFIYDYICIHKPKIFERDMKALIKKYFGTDIPSAEISRAAAAAYAEYYGYLKKIADTGDEYIKKAREEGLPIIVLCGRPYHLDGEVNHGIDTLIRSMGVAVLSEDSLGNHYEPAGGDVLNQWTYHARLYSAAKFVSRPENNDINIVQLVSFGCGLDAITTDEMREILESNNKIYTQLKIDEISNPGAVKIRLRSLIAAAEQKGSQNDKQD